MTIKYSIIMAAVIATGCSGGGDSTTSTSTGNTGVFLDSAVEGINYSTNTVSGTTDTKGQFEYNDGETVTFSLYGQPISKALGFDAITPLDNTDSSVGDDYLINVLRFLQTMDTDSDPTNGITLPNVSGDMNIDFDQSPDDFSADADVNSFIAANANSTLVSPPDAIDHFATTLASISNAYTLDLTGKNASSVITSSFCNVDFQVGFNYKFTTTGYTFSGIDTINSTNFGNCTAGTFSTSTDTFNSFPDFGLDCGPTCSYNDLNTVRTGVDADGRDFITTIAHTPNTNIVSYIKRITNDPANPGFTWSNKEVITIGGLTGQTLVGSWYIPSNNKTLITFIDETNYYVTQEIGTGEPLCSHGMESGTYTWNSVTGTFNLTNVIDTTDDCGLTSSQGETYTASLEISGNTLSMTDTEGTLQLSKVVDASKPIVGSWYVVDENKTLVTFIDDSNYFVTQEVGPDELTATPPSFHGMEAGTYTHDSVTGDIVFTNVIDTTGDSGFTSIQGEIWDNVTVNIINNQLMFTFVGGSFSLDAIK